MSGAAERWPSLPYADWSGTLHAVHMWTQVLGKIRLALTPLVKHRWNSTLPVTPRGLSTSLLRSGDETFQIDLDFVEHELVTITSRGSRSERRLQPMSVARFYQRVLEDLSHVGVPTPRIAPVPPTACLRRMRTELMSSATVEAQSRSSACTSLIRQESPIDDRGFEIEFLDPGVEAFAFTFG